MVTDQLADAIRSAVADAAAAGELNIGSDEFEINLELPRNKQFGDYACNLALSLARQAGMQSRDVAARIAQRLPVGNGLIERVEIAGPGFLNFYLRPTWLQDTLIR